MYNNKSTQFHVNRRVRQVVSCNSDDIGNSLKKWSDGCITLELTAEKGRVRNLGYISNGVFHTTRKLKHLHYKSNSYGFNHKLLEIGKSFDWVLLRLENGYSYKIPKAVILASGKIMYFKNTQYGNSYEIQIFLPMSIIDNYKYE
jgi:hypothetical protein